MIESNWETAQWFKERDYFTLFEQEDFSVEDIDKLRIEGYLRANHVKISRVKYLRERS